MRLVVKLWVFLASIACIGDAVSFPHLHLGTFCPEILIGMVCVFGCVRLMVSLFVRLWKHFVGKLQQIKNAAFNYPEYGNLCHMQDIVNKTWQNPDGYMLKKESVVIGHGSQVFRKASRILHDFSFLRRLEWMDVATVSQGLSIGEVFGTITGFYRMPLWSFNPCRCLSSVQDGSYTVGSNGYCSTDSTLPIPRQTGRYSEVVFSTLEGHVIAGEEALRVYTVPKIDALSQQGIPNNRAAHTQTCSAGGPHPGQHEGNVDTSATRAQFSTDGDAVVFEVVSYSRGSGILRRLCMPFLRPLQDKFMRDCCSSMRQLVNDT